MLVLQDETGKPATWTDPQEANLLVAAAAGRERALPRIRGLAAKSPRAQPRNRATASKSLAGIDAKTIQNVRASRKANGSFPCAAMACVILSSSCATPDIQTSTLGPPRVVSRLPGWPRAMTKLETLETFSRSPWPWPPKAAVHAAVVHELPWRRRTYWYHSPRQSLIPRLVTAERCLDDDVG